VNWRRGRRFLVSAIGRDIVSTFRKMSTKPDQGQTDSNNRVGVAMSNDRTIGVVLGSLVCAVAVTGNVLRADPHVVSVYPDLVSMAIAPIVVYILGRRRRLHGDSSDAVGVFGVRVGRIAGGVFAFGLGLFSLYWLGAWPLWAFGTGAAFGSVFALSSLAAYAAGHQRINAV
jgi:hypothetical protein